MSTREFFIKRWEEELPAFGRVLRAVPDNQLSYKPHERCTSAGALAYQLADEQKQMATLFDSGEVQLEIKPHPKKVADIVAEWDRATEDLRKRLAKIDEKKWASPAKLMMGGKEVWADTLENVFWGYLFDMVHHRGQLSSYIRPMGGKVPAIYGPSGDEGHGS